MSADLRIAITVPSHGQWCAGTAQNIANMVQTFTAARYDGGSKVAEVFAVSGSMLPDVRHRCVYEAAKWDATHLLTLDADMLVPRDTLQMLLRHGKPIVGANYSRRQIGTLTTCHGLDGETVYTEEGDTRLLEVAHVGTGCLLVDMRVFDALDLPYFAFETDASGVGLVGEDVYFCRKARAVGFQVFCDQQLSWEIGHIGETTYTHHMVNVARREAAALQIAAE